MRCNAEVVAVCERDDWKIKRAKERLGKDTFTVYKDFDEFIKHDMDAVFLCNRFDDHTKYAIKCLERGIHVLSETTSNSTMAEGVELVRAVEKSKAIYMLEENYPFMKFNLEMKKVYENGTWGKALFCEGEYNHPSQSSPRSVKELMPYDKHWRRYLPKTYYLTHSLAPLMWITGATPKRVTAMPVYEPQMMSSGYVGGYWCDHDRFERR